MTDSDRIDMIPFMFDEIVVEGDTRSREYAYAHVCPQCANLCNLPTTDTCCDGNICLVKGCQNETSLVHYLWDYRGSGYPPTQQEETDMTDPSPMETVSERFYNESQSWHYERIVKYKDLKLRVYIRRNAYDDQSYLRGFAFDPVHLKWNVLVDKPMNKSVRCYTASYVQDTTSIEPFRTDAMAIFGELLQIVS